MTSAFRHRSGGTSLAVSRTGSGPKVLVVHGGPGLDHHVLDPFVAHLATSYELWALDLPGHGRSHAEGERLPDLHAVTERTARWLAGFGPDTVILGHSLGAWIVREAIRRGRVRPKATVWVSPPAGAGARRASPVRARIEAFDYPSEFDDDVDAVKAEFISFAAQETATGVTDAFREAVARSRIRPPWAYGPLLRQLHRALLRATPRFRPPCPVLVVCGDRDRTTPTTHAIDVADATEGAVLQLVEGEGHVPFADGKSGIADAVLAFLDDVVRPRA